MGERAFATRLDRELKHRVQLVFGNHETLAANSRNASRAVRHPEVSAQAWQGFPENEPPENWVQRRHKEPGDSHRTSNARRSRCELVPGSRIAALLNTGVATAPSRPPTRKSSSIVRVTVSHRPRSYRAAVFLVSSIPAARNKRRRNRIMVADREHQFHVAFRNLVDACRHRWCGEGARPPLSRAKADDEQKERRVLHKRLGDQCRMESAG